MSQLVKSQERTPAERSRDKNMENPASAKRTPRGLSDHGRDTRQKIIDAGRELLIEKGYAEFRLRDVAECAGLSIGNLPYHFPTKRDLIHAILDAASERHMESLKRSVASAATVLSQLYAVVDAGLALIDEPENTAWLSIGVLAQHDAELADKIESADKMFAQAIAEQLLIIRPQLTVPRAQQIARFFTVTLNGFALESHGANAKGAEQTARRSALCNELRSVMAVLTLESYIGGAN
jgi:AcrR family transcriptional regulator